MRRPNLAAVGAQSVLLAASTGLSQLAIAVLFILAARATDPAALGVVAAAMAIGLVFAGLVDFGSNSFWIRESARGALPFHQLGHRILSKAFICAAAAPVLAVALLWAAPGTMLWTAAFLGFATVVGQSAQVPLRGAALGHRASLVIVVDRSVAVITYVVLTSSGTPAAHALIVALITGPVTAALAAVRLTPSMFAPVYTGFRFRWPWKHVVNFGVSTTFLSLQAIDVAILALLSGSAAAGIYGAVSKWVQPVNILAGAFAAASAPFVARSGHARDAWVILRRAAWMPALAVVVAAALAVSSPWLIQVLLGPAYAEGALVLTVLALAAIPGVLNQPLFVALQSLGRDRAVAVVLAGAVILQLALVGILAPQVGALSCALAVLVVQVLQLAAFSVLMVQELHTVGGTRAPAADVEERS